MPKKQKRDNLILVLVGAAFFALYFLLPRLWQANRWVSLLALLVLIFVISLFQRVRLQQQREQVKRVLRAENISVEQLAAAANLDKRELKDYLGNGPLMPRQRYRLEELLDQRFPQDKK